MKLILKIFSIEDAVFITEIQSFNNFYLDKLKQIGYMEHE